MALFTSPHSESLYSRCKEREGEGGGGRGEGGGWRQREKGKPDKISSWKFMVHSHAPEGISN